MKTVLMMKQKRKLHIKYSGILLWLSLFATISCTTTPAPVTPETALQNYLQNEDQSFAWEILGSQDIKSLTAYSLILTSQKWREHTWKHTLTVLVPEEMNHDGALLFITGGKNKDGNPVVRGGDDEFIQTMARVAQKNSAMVAIIWPLLFPMVKSAVKAMECHPGVLKKEPSARHCQVCGYRSIKT